jgi:hypothetical protein
VHQLALAALQSAFDFPQGVRPAKLAEQLPTHWLQLDKPLLRYSAPVSLTMRWKSVRGMSLSIWLNMLHDAFTLGLLRLEAGGFGDSPTPYTFG